MFKVETMIVIVRLPQVYVKELPPQPEIFSAKLKSITNKGLLQVAFDVPIVVPPQFKNWTQNDLNDIIKLEVEAGEMQDPLKCGIASFAITDFTAQKLTL